jgi:3-hydroxybutyryl-CoA dehydratase
LPDIFHFEDLKVGQRWQSPGRVVSAQDVACFAELTGDHTALHLSDDQSTCGNSPFGRPVAHGLLGLSIMAGLSSEHPKVNTVALIHLGEYEFRQPIYFGDVVIAETEVIALQPYGRRAGRVQWKRRLLGERGQVFQEGILETIVGSRAMLKRTPTKKATLQSLLPVPDTMDTLR